MRSANCFAIATQSQCCGIAGTYGFKKENYETSQGIGSSLFAEIEKAKVDVVATDCETMKLIQDDAVIDAIVAEVMELQDQENTTLPLLEKQMREVENGIENMLNAIQAGVLTNSTKLRLEKLEAQQKELEIRIAEEEIARPRLSENQVRFWLTRFRKLDPNVKSHRETLINTFVNAVYLYDEKVKRT